MWKKQTKYVKYRSKGTFATCSVCNVINGYLSHESKFRFSEHGRAQLRTYRRRHLKRQEEARERVDFIKNRCKTSRDINGNPTEAFFFADAASTWAGNTPKCEYCAGRTSKNDSEVYTDRSMGVEIVCGDIDVFVIFHSGDLVASGANYMIEVQRMAFLELSKRLRALGLDMPRKVHLQYDNCAENKNKLVCFCNKSSSAIYCFAAYATSHSF